MNKKALSPVTVVFWLLLFFILWSLVLGGLLSEVCQQAITQGNLTGASAFILDNINFIVVIFLILFLIGAYYFYAGGV